MAQMMDISRIYLKHGKIDQGPGNYLSGPYFVFKCLKDGLRHLFQLGAYSR